MMSRSHLLRNLRTYRPSLISPSYKCLLTTKAAETPGTPASEQSPTPPLPAAAENKAATGQPKTTQLKPQNPTHTPPQKPTQLLPEKSWLTRQVETSPAAKKAFLRITNMLGYGSPKQLAGRRTLVLYERVCAAAPDHARQFWQNECFLPPTFQSWFTITNLHIWMLSVRLRALPPPHGTHHLQALIDHFFIDIEDRIRTVLQPPAEPTKPYTFATEFYVNPNAPAPDKPRSRAPDRIVTRQMKIFKEQWSGMGLSFDLGLVKSDQELAAAVWRNILGARGAQGIAYPDPSLESSPTSSSPRFRRAVNLVGGEVVNVAKIDLEKEETSDDGSGVHDFAPVEIDKYLTYPERMLDVVAYVRREVARLDGLSDEEVMGGDWEKVKFGQVKAKELR